MNAAEVPILVLTGADHDYAQRLAQRCQLQVLSATDANLDQHEFVLELTPTQLQLRWLAAPKMLPLVVDFSQGKAAFRAAKASLKDEAIGRACGLAKYKSATILDGTAGLGRDALVLAQLGATVLLRERNPVVAALLLDGLQRLQHSDANLATRLQWYDDSYQGAIDVVYLDPMYPKSDRKQRAAVKKDMQMFQQLVGADHDADQLLADARAKAQYRVVVKRPQHADFLDQQPPQSQVISKKHRFDIYLTEQSHDSSQ